MEDFIRENDICRIEFGEDDCKLRVGVADDLVIIESDEGTGVCIKIYPNEARLLAEMLPPFADKAEANRVEAEDDEE